MTKIIPCFRFVTDDMKSQQDDKTMWEIGEWKKHEGEIVPCKSGFHASKTPNESIQNIYGVRWFMAEARGIIVEKDDKFAASEMRLIKEIPSMVLKRFALFCAKDCVRYYEEKYPEDKRISNCIQITEEYLDGKTTKKKLKAATRAAEAAAEAARVAWAAGAAGAAVGAAVWAAARAAGAAAWAAARAAARVAGAAAWAAWAAGAAGAAAWAAVWAAVWVAEAATWSAEAAAEAAARSAAWSAEAAAEAARVAVGAAARSARKRQEKELNRLIKEWRGK